MAQRLTCRDIPIAKITSHLLQARKQVDRTETERLIASIHRRGLLSPILVRKRGREFELLSGQRRVQACRRLGWDTIPAVVLDIDDPAAVEVCIAENVERVQLSPMERVELLDYLSKAFSDASPGEMAARLGFRADQADQVRLLAKLPMLLKEAVNMGVVSAEQALVLGRLQDEEAMGLVLRTIHDKGLDLQQTEDLVERLLEGGELEAGPKRTLSLPDLLARVDLVYRAGARGKPLDPRVVLPLVDELLDSSKRPLDEFLSNEGIESGAFPLHAFYVARIAILLARGMGMDEAGQKTAAFAGILQDLGMVRVPLDVLMYEGPLNEEGRSEVRRHVEATQEILDAAGWVPSLARQAVAAHHERLDGSGYPRGLAGEEVPPLARLLAVADTYAAVGESRPWRTARLPHEGIESLVKEGEAGRLDPAIVSVWVGLVSRYPIRSFVRLATGEVARVVQARPADPDRPVVEILYDLSGRRLQEAWRVDLSESDDVAFEPCAPPGGESAG